MVNEKGAWCVIVPCADIERAVDVAEIVDARLGWETFIKWFELKGRDAK